MEEVSIDRLNDYVQSYNEDKLLIIVLWTRYCSKCEPFIDRVKNLKEDFNHLHFITTEIDELPLFAPPGTPAMVAYYNNQKVIEHLGDLNEMELDTTLRQWYNILINHLRKHYGNHNP